MISRITYPTFMTKRLYILSVPFYIRFLAVPILNLLYWLSNYIILLNWRMRVEPIANPKKFPTRGQKGNTWSTLCYGQEMDHINNSFLQVRATLSMQEIYYGMSSNEPGNYGTTRGHQELKTQLHDHRKV